MTPVTRRTSDPPASRPRESDAAEAGELPARVPLLTMHSLYRNHSGLLTHLANSSFELRRLAHWDQLLGECERFQAGVVLLDLDEAERSPGLRELGLSAHRLAQLLARELKDKAAALVIVSERDYAEIEDLMRAGVHALLHPHSSAEWCLDQVRTAAARRKALYTRRRASYKDSHKKRCDIVATAVKRAVEPPLAAAPPSPHPLTEPIVASVASPIVALLP
jgi:DNA-binding NarL/FixJ family response regulator